LIVCDRAVEANAEPDAWRLEIVAAAESAAYGGPFIIDRAHPLCVGLSLDGAIWSADPNAKLGGSTVVTAGNVPLLSDGGPTVGRRLRMNCTAQRSNLQDVPDWPILFANLLRWRRESRPGAATLNARLGQTVAVSLAGDERQVELVPPGGAAQYLQPRDRRVEVPADRVGIFTLKTPRAEYAFACNALSSDESDLRSAAAGRWGSWNLSPIHQQREASLRWALALAALAVLAGHQKLVSVATVWSEA